MPPSPPCHIRKLIQVFVFGELSGSVDSARNTGGAGDCETGFLTGTPPPLPLGAVVTFPAFAWYFFFSFVPMLSSDNDVRRLVDVAGRWNGLNLVDSFESIRFNLGSLCPLEPPCVELLRDVLPRLASLEIVTVRWGRVELV